MENKNDSPRTDAAINIFHNNGYDAFDGVTEYVTIEFARTLEKELSEAWAAHEKTFIESDKTICELSQQLATATKENTYIRGQLQSVKCPYGHKSENGVCSLGYPGCACADDWFAAQDESNRDLIIKFKDIEAKLTVAIAERDKWAGLAGTYAGTIESLTTLCAKLDNALRCANNCYCGDPYGQKVIDEALAHAAELLKKKE